MKKLKVTQVKSEIGASSRQRANLEALGLKGITTSREHEATPVILGMVRKVRHLVEVEDV